jgi:microcystin-dependent protein
MALSNYPKFKAWATDGTFLVGGLLYTYDAGTSTPKATYQDKAKTVPHANPIVLDANGEALIYTTGSYKFILKTSAGVTLWTLDNYLAANELIEDLTPEADKFPYYTSGTAAALTAITALARTFLARATAQLMRNDLDVPNRSLTEITGTAAGTNTYTLNLDPAITSYTSGAYYFITFTNANTGAATINMNSLGAKSIKTQGGAALTAGSLRAGFKAILKYDGTDMILMNESIPPGHIIMWPTSTPPAGYLECDGSSLLRASYPDLFAVISDDYGAADGTHFNIPDYRGRFLRGWSHGQTTDPDKASRTDRGDGTVGDYVGTEQAEQFLTHDTDEKTPVITVTDNLTVSSGAGAAATVSQDPAATVSQSSALITVTATQAAHKHTATGGNETRPVNTNIMFCIKY